MNYHNGRACMRHRFVFPAKEFFLYPIIRELSLKRDLQVSLNVSQNGISEQ